MSCQLHPVFVIRASDSAEQSCSSAAPMRKVENYLQSEQQRNLIIAVFFIEVSRPAESQRTKRALAVWLRANSLYVPTRALNTSLCVPRSL